MKLFIKIVGIILYSIVMFLILKNDYNEINIALAVLFPVYISIIIDYFKYQKTINANRHILLSKSSKQRYSNIIFYVIGLFLCVSYFDFYLVALIILILVTGYLDYLMTKRRALIINKQGIRDVHRGKERELCEITLFEIYPNNIEIRFNEAEILQLNKNEILSPTWEELVSQMKKLKTDHGELS